MLWCCRFGQGAPCAAVLCQLAEGPTALTDAFHVPIHEQGRQLRRKHRSPCQHASQGGCVTCLNSFDLH